MHDARSVIGSGQAVQMAARRFSARFSSLLERALRARVRVCQSLGYPFGVLEIKLKPAWIGL